MKKTGNKKGESQGLPQILLPIVGLLATVKGTLYELVVGSGLRVLEALLEQEREQAVRCSLPAQSRPDGLARRLRARGVDPRRPPHLRETATGAFQRRPGARSAELGDVLQ